jgi:hypothetical protein
MKLVAFYRRKIGTLKHSSYGNTHCQYDYWYLYEIKGDLICTQHQKPIGNKYQYSWHVWRVSDHR